MVKSVKTTKASDKKVRGVKKSAPKKAVKRVIATPANETVTASKKYTNMFAAYRAFWTRGFTDWAGTSSRSEYWLAWCANILLGLMACMVLISLDFVAVHRSADIFVLCATFVMLGLLLLYGFAAFVPSLSMGVRRLRDGGFSPWWVLLYPVAMFVPYIGYVAAVVLFIFMLMPTRAHDKNNK